MLLLCKQIRILLGDIVSLLTYFFLLLLSKMKKSKSLFNPQDIFLYNPRIEEKDKNGLWGPSRKETKLNVSLTTTSAKAAINRRKKIFYGTFKPFFKKMLDILYGKGLFLDFHNKAELLFRRFCNEFRVKCF